MAPRACSPTCALLLATVMGCAGQHQVLDAKIVNGTVGYKNVATVTASAGSGATIVSATPWKGGATASPGAPAEVEFIHFEKTRRKAEAGPLPEEGASPECSTPPSLQLAKLVEYDGRLADHVYVDTTDLNVQTVDLTWHFFIRNASECSSLHKIRLLDNLPEGFEAKEVVALPDGPNGLAVFAGFLGAVIPGIVALAVNDYGFRSFDSSKWNVQQVGGASAFIFEGEMNLTPFKPGRHIHLIVRGTQKVPARKAREE